MEKVLNHEFGLYLLHFWRWMVNLCKSFWIISLACFFFTFESEWWTYVKGSESVISLVFSSLLKVNGKLMQKLLNPQFGWYFLQLLKWMVIFWKRFWIINLASIFFTSESEWYTYAKGSELLISLIFSSLFKVNGKLLLKVLNH